MLQISVLFFCLLTSLQACDNRFCTCSNGSCLSCLYNFQYPIDNTCYSCPYMCRSCQSSLACTACISNYYLWEGSCLLCPQNCKSCSGGCQQCIDGYFLSNGQCQQCSSDFVLTCDATDTVLTCQSGYWQNGNSCSPCREFCLICSSPSNCLTCQEGYYVAISFGSYCARCSQGCQSCSASGCTQCLFNYYLQNGLCLSIAQNCTSIPYCLNCTYASAQIACYSCVFPYYLSGGRCILGSSILCQSGATGPMHYQCLGSCTPYGTIGMTWGTQLMCLPLAWTSSYKQIYINSYTPVFSNHLYSTSNEFIYFNNQENASAIAFSLQFQPYFKLSLRFKLVADVPLNSTISLNVTLVDSASNTDSNSLTFISDSTPYAYYPQITTSKLKHQAVNITINATSLGLVAPVVGLSELLVQAYPCPDNCKLCYNAELCMQCLPSYFNTPDYTCVAACSGYLQIYLPRGNISDFQYKECVLSCPDGFYAVLINSTYRCQPCQGLCLTCLSPTQCLSCVAGYLYYEIDLQCLTTCPSTHYRLADACSPCVAPCQTCLDATTCLSCSIGYFWKGNCEASCPLGTFANTTANSCDPCDNSCTSCEDTPTYCFSCNQPYLLFESSCVSSCQSDLYYEYDRQCLSCMFPCSTCSNSTSCRSCESGYLFGDQCYPSCVSGYYSDALTSTCNVCQNGCLTCSSDNICLSCPNTTNLFSYQCITACPAGSYPDAQICISCLNPCSTCSNRTYCLSCSMGYLSQITQGSCVAICEDGFYANHANSTCLQCYNSCLTCSAASACTACDPALVLERGNCLSSCTLGFYNLSGLCMGCSLPCLGCVGADYYCQSCQEGYILINGSCLSQCPIYSYLQNQTCIACIQPCQTCTAADVCLSCLPSASNQTYLFSSECLLVCPDGYYADAVSLSCRTCSYPCLLCSAQTVCLSCLNGYLNPASNNCEYCSGLWYPNDTSKECQLCSAALPSCKQCLSASECVVCESDSYLLRNSCVSKAQCLTLKQYYVDDSLLTCSACTNPCLTCTNSTFCLSCVSAIVHQGSCLSLCPDGWYQSSTTCLPCPGSCLTCKNESACLSCNTTGAWPVYLRDFYECISGSSCGQGYYIDGSYGWSLCLKCQSPCRTCTNSSFCLSCLSGLNYLGSCKSICPSGYYTPVDIPACFLCDSNCLKCSVASSNCTACSAALYLKNGSCVSTCGEGYYLDNYIYQCFACVFPCLNCSSASTCLSCFNSTYILYQGQCILSCPSGTYNTNQTCQNCPSTCLTCQLNSTTSTVVCISCISGMFMSIADPGVCLDSCGAHSYGDVITLRCYNCIDPCVDCINAISCLSCIESYLLVDTQCLAIDRCPAGRYLWDRQCVIVCPNSLWGDQNSGNCSAQCLAPALKLVSDGVKLCVGGCLSGYKVDRNYTCAKCQGSNCNGLLQVSVQVKSIFNSLYLKISFSETVQLSSLSASDIMVTVNSIQNRLLTSSIAYSVSVVNLNAIWLRLETRTSISNSIITITFRDYYLLGVPLQSLTYHSEICSFDLYDPDIEEKGKRFESFSQTMSLIMIVIFLLNLLLNSGYLSYLIIDCYQLLFMVLFLAIDYPPPLNRFLYGFRYSHYLFLPQVFRGDPSQEYSSETPDKFGVIVPDVYFLNNTGPSFIVIAIAIVVLLLSKLMQLCVRRLSLCRSNRVAVEDSLDHQKQNKQQDKERQRSDKSGKEAEGDRVSNSRQSQKEQSIQKDGEGRCGRLLQAIISRYKWNYFNDLIYIIYFSTMLFAFSQLYDLTWRSGKAADILSILLAFLFLISGLLAPPGLAYFLDRQKDNLIEKSMSHERQQFQKKLKEQNRQYSINSRELSGSLQSENRTSKVADQQQGQNVQYEVLTQYKCFVAGVRLRVRLGFYHIPLNYFKKLVYACLMVYSSEFPSFVLGVAMMLCLINILIVVLLKPYRLTFEQIIFPIFDCIYLLVFFTICIMQLPLANLSQTQKLNASYLAIGLCILLSVLIAIHNVVINVVEIIKFCWGIDYLSKYYQTEFVETTQHEEEQSEEHTNVPLKKESKETESMLSGLDIYLHKEEGAPKFLIKCLKPELEEREDRQPQKLHVGDIKLSEVEGSDAGESESASESGASRQGSASGDNIFLNIQTIQVEGDGND